MYTPTSSILGAAIIAVRARRAQSLAHTCARHVQARNDRRRAIQRNTCYIRQKLEAASPAESVESVLAEVAKLEESIAPFEHRADVIRTGAPSQTNTHAVYAHTRTPRARCL